MIVKNSFDIAIIGSGFPGMATAFFLGRRQKHLSVCLIERNPKPASEASGKNAGMVRQIVENPDVLRLGSEGRRWINRLGASSFVRPGGSLLLANGDFSPAMQNAFKTARHCGVSYSILSDSVIRRKFRSLQTGRFRQGVFTPGDLKVDLDGFRAFMRKKLKERGVRLFVSSPGKVQIAENGRFEIRTPGQKILATRLVNAAGAWAPAVATQARAQNIPIESLRRHLFRAPRPPHVTERHPFVWHLDEGIYFRPYGRGEIILSPCDEKRVTAGRERFMPGLIESAERKMNTLIAGWQKPRSLKGWAGLRTFSPDGKPLIGWDKQRKNFFWLACLGGHGLTCALSAGKLAADLILSDASARGYERAFAPSRVFV